MQEKELGASIIMALSRGIKKIPFVSNPNNRKFLQRFPGGKIKAGETPQQAAVRELFEETGLIIPLSSIIETTGVLQPNKHIRYFIVAIVDQFGGSITRGNSGEITKLWTPQEALYSPGFLLSHRELAKTRLLEAIYDEVSV